jgi:ABC-type Fe3+/spermidine/putrescine transport system ATPase subunit
LCETARQKACDWLDNSGGVKRKSEQRWSRQHRAEKPSQRSLAPRPPVILLDPPASVIDEVHVIDP